MIYKTGRNDLCPCGSGKKYKKCCIEQKMTSIISDQKNTPLDFEWRQLRELEGNIIGQHLLPYATQELSKKVIESALLDFFPEELPEDVDKEALFENFFVPWFLFNWIPYRNFGLKQFNGEVTIAQNYLLKHENKLNSQKRLFIDTMMETYYSFYTVQEIEAGKSIVLKDILLETTHTIKEKLGTYKLKRGDIIFSRLLTLNNQSISIGMAPYVIPIRYGHGLIDFRNELIESNNNNALTPEDLRHNLNEILLACFFDIMESLFDKPLPTLMNTDGELISFSKSYFKLTISPEDTFDKLIPLTFPDNPKELLEDAKRDKKGQIKQLEFPWIKMGNKKMKDWDNTILGHIIIEQGKLILETNSYERAQKGKDLLNKYLGNSISFQKTLIEQPEQKLKSLDKNIFNDTQWDDEVLEIPEIKEKIQLMQKNHWERWFDEPIPLLKNQTPREAAMTKDGKERLESLLMEFEPHNLESPTNLMKADIVFLRKELRLD